MKNWTDITFVLDRSGSMASVAQDVIGGYQTFVEEQQKVGHNASMSLMQFDTEFETVFSGVPIQNVSSRLVFLPRGMTALRDALGKTINSVGERLRNLPESERPDKVMIIVLTDGEENASVEFTDQAALAKMVKHQQDVYNWQFVFLGANIDSFATAGGLGIGAYTTSNYAANSVGMTSALRGVSVYTTSTRCSEQGVSNISMTAAYEKAAFDQMAEDEAERRKNNATNALLAGSLGSAV